MKKFVLILFLLCSIEGTAWRYYCPMWDFSMEYTFKGGNVYLLQDGVEYMFPNTNGQYACYGKDWAVMYQYENPFMWGLLISDFNTKRAVELLPLPPVLRFELNQINWRIE